jgi:signal transduction histidine kinase
MVGLAHTNPPEPDLATIISAYNDVTERLKRSHELLRGEVVRLRDELHEKNRELARRERLSALGEMAAGVAHEIRNPLGGIGLYASLLERDLDDRPVQADIVRRIRVGVRNLESVVGDILAFAGGQEPHRQQVRLWQMLDDAVTQVSPRSDETGARLVVERGEVFAAVPGYPTLNVDVTLDCDPRQVERAVLNLLFNAIDAAGERGHVRIRAERDGVDRGFISIVVEDDGPGIAAESLERIFNPFFTTKENGTGLGLAIVHRIAEAHGGHVTAANRVGGGARFVLSLPLAAEAEAG